MWQIRYREALVLEGAEYLEVRQQPACAEANVKNFRLATGSDGCTHTRFELGSAPTDTSSEVLCLWLSV